MDNACKYDFLKVDFTRLLVEPSDLTAKFLFLLISLTGSVSLCLCQFLSVCLSLSLFPSIHASVRLCLSVSLLVCLSLSLSVTVSL